MDIGIGRQKNRWKNLYLGISRQKYTLTKVYLGIDGQIDGQRYS